jgi:hypothetical protein
MNFLLINSVIQTHRFLLPPMKFIRFRQLILLTAAGNKKPDKLSIA